MPDDRNEVRHVNWSEVFTFSHLFKGFKLAIHPSKLILALAAIVLVCIAGQVLQNVWALSKTHGFVTPVDQAYVAPQVMGDPAMLETADIKAPSDSRVKLFSYLSSNVEDSINGSLHAAATGNAWGFAYSVRMLASTVTFMWSQHYVFMALLTLIALAIWGLFGGAIHRIAALHAARDEKISIGQALRFSAGKWLSFVTAPLLPLVAAVMFGLLIALGALIANIPWVGAPIFAIILFLALGIGLGIAFLMIGLAAGAGLMYPTIAAEGSDAFDAISRSFAYIFGRPWRTILYNGVALVYGAICYLFVRLFAFVALLATYQFVKLGVFTNGWRDNALFDDKVQFFWSPPQFDHLISSPAAGAGPGETFAGWIVWFWVAIIAALVAAFVVSYFSSVNTIIYLLLRRKIDATDMDDVYVQESHEPPADEAKTPQTIPAAPASPTASTATPAAPAASDEPIPLEGSEPPKTT